MPRRTRPESIRAGPGYGRQSRPLARGTSSGRVLQRASHAVNSLVGSIDFLFGDGQTPLRQAMTALTHAAKWNPRVHPQLQAVIDWAAPKMGHEVRSGSSSARWRAWWALEPLAIGDENVTIAMRRLQRVVEEYRAWAGATAPLIHRRPALIPGNQMA